MTFILEIEPRPKEENNYFYIFTRRVITIEATFSKNDDESESQENSESETVIPTDAVIPTEYSHFDKIVNRHFDEIVTIPNIIPSNAINDKEQEPFRMNEQRWCFIHWVIAGLMFILMIYFVFLCITMCSKVPVEKTVQAQNYLKNIVSCKRISAKEEMCENLI